MGEKTSPLVRLIILLVVLITLADIAAMILPAIEASYRHLP